MKKLLLIALLIVGCNNSTESKETCEICDVAWLTTQDSLTLSTGTFAYPYLYYTEGYEPMVIDTLFWCFRSHTHLGDSYDYCIQVCEQYNASLPEGFLTLDCQSEPSVALFIYSLKGDTTFLQLDSVKSISHFVTPNYFEVIDVDNDKTTIYYSDDVQYEYK